jgi:heterodisulfide reductase subunit C2
LTRYSRGGAASVSDPAFADAVEKQAHTGLNRCYQCLTCSLGCPVLFAMEYRPDQIVRMVRLGLRREVLTSSAIWLCASCDTCLARCPNEVRIPQLMDTLRQMSLDEGLASERNIAVFNRIFLKSVERWGKQHELAVMLTFKVKTRDFFSDVGLGMNMMAKRKLKLGLPSGKTPDEIKRVFRKSRQAGKQP